MSDSLKPASSTAAEADRSAEGPLLAAKDKLTGRGDYREIWSLAYPVILAMLSETALGVADTYMVAKLGKLEVAAVGLASMMGWLCYLFFIGLAMTVNTFVAQSFGAKDYADCGRMAWQGLYLGLVSGVLIWLSIVLAPTLFALAKPSVAVQELGVQYLQLRLLDGPFVIMSVVISSFFRGIGDTKTPMWVNLFINLANILFNYLLIFGHWGLPRLEVQGAALGSAFAGFLFFFVYLVLFLRSSLAIYATKRLILPSWQRLKRLTRVGLPIGLQRWLDVASFVSFSALIGRMGDDPLAANQISIQIMSVSFVVGFGISMASTIAMGQYIGSKNLPAAERSTYTAVKMAVAYMGFMGVIFFVLPRFLISLFNDDPQVVALGEQILRMVALFQVFDAVGITLLGALRGAGDTLWTMMVSLVGAWLVFLPLAYLLGIYLDFGVVGAWGGATVYIIGLGLTFYGRFRSGAWKAMKI